MSLGADRRLARAAWEIVITREAAGQHEGEEHNDLYWLRVPVADRARLTWDLSRELYALAARNGGVFDEETGTFQKLDEGDLERRLPRASYVVTRR